MKQHAELKVQLELTQSDLAKVVPSIVLVLCGSF
jgi:hypothetical protein